MKVKVLRRKSPITEPYWETFEADVPAEISIAGLLDFLNYNDDILNNKGERTTRIGWECSCLQGICGGCAMVINGIPSLACETFIKDLKGDLITIEPLKKFPPIHDLVVDRSVIQENLRKSNVHIGKFNPAEIKSEKKREREYIHQYTAAKCLKCGLCLEVCPNYVDGKNFYGALFANDCYLVSSRNHEKGKDVKKLYDEHFGGNCSKSLSCMDVCPMKIPTMASIGKMQR